MSKRIRVQAGESSGFFRLQILANRPGVPDRDQQKNHLVYCNSSWRSFREGSCSSQWRHLVPQHVPLSLGGTDRLLNRYNGLVVKLKGDRIPFWSGFVAHRSNLVWPERFLGIVAVDNKLKLILWWNISSYVSAQPRLGSSKSSDDPRALCVA